MSQKEKIIAEKAIFLNGSWLYENCNAAQWFWIAGDESLPNKEANNAHLIATTLELLNDTRDE